MQPVAEPVARLIEEFAKLPGIGPKTAQRLTFHLLRGSRKEEAESLAEAIHSMKEKVGFCTICFNISENATSAVFVPSDTQRPERHLRGRGAAGRSGAGADRRVQGNVPCAARCHIAH